MSTDPRTDDAAIIETVATALAEIAHSSAFSRYLPDVPDRMADRNTFRSQARAVLAALDLPARDARVRANAEERGWHRGFEHARRYPASPSSSPVDAPSRPTGPCCTDAFDSEGNEHDPGCLYLLGIRAGRTAATADLPSDTGEILSWLQRHGMSATPGAGVVLSAVRRDVLGVCSACGPVTP